VQYVKDPIKSYVESLNNKKPSHYLQNILLNKLTKNKDKSLSIELLPSELTFFTITLQKIDVEIFLFNKIGLTRNELDVSENNSKITITLSSQEKIESLKDLLEQGIDIER
jgi:hypothetical protein